MVMMYEVSRLLVVRDKMPFRAVVEPIFMRERRIVTIRETRTAFKGMFQPGVT